MTKQNQYSFLYDTYEWLLPAQFNIADVCCHRWAASPHEARQAAIYFEDQVGQLTMLSYGQLSERVNKLANAFVRMGVQSQDRIAITLQHSAETAVTILAAITVGAIAMPLGAGLSVSDYEKRLLDSGTKIAIVDKHTIAQMTNAIDHNPQLRGQLRQIIGINTGEERVIPWRTLLARQPDTFHMPHHDANTPVMMLYHSDGEQLRASLIPHSALLGALPGFVASQNWFPKGKDIFFTSYDWSDPIGLLNALLPTLYFGRTIVGCPSGRTIPRLFTLLEHYQITNVLTAPEELKRIQSFNDPLHDFDLKIRCISVPDHPQSADLSAWVKSHFNADLNCYFAPTGFAYIIGDSAEKWPTVANAMGKAYPGHLLAVLSEDGTPCKPDEVGMVCVNALDQHGFPDPGLSKQFWQNGRIQDIPPYAPGWYSTGVRARLDTNQSFWREI